MMNDLFAQRVNPDVSSALAGLFPQDPNPTAVTFAAGSPNEQLFPVKEVQAAFNTAIDTQGAHLFQYQSAQGNSALREKLVTRIAKWGNVTTTADNILLTVGGQQGVELVAKTLLDPGDDIIVEVPTYIGALAAFDLYQPHYHAVPLQADGLDLDALETTLQQHPNVKLLYTVPDYHNPTGITMSVAKRQQLVALANRYHFIILEDTPYRDLGYEGAPLPAIKSFDTEGRVIFLSSFSKILMPALRTGWLIADGELRDAILKMRLASDLETTGVTHAAINAYLDANDLDAHIQRMTTHYKQQRDAMLQSLTHYFPDEALFTHPAGGFFDWVTLPQGIDTGRLMLDVISPQAHVTYVPATNFYPQRDVHNALRLSFSGVNPTQIDAGMHRLGDQLKNAVHAAYPVF
ncbi:PLP-dependent aminotransferase family protein [Levilactobacillus brevis]|uniref:aminotransferase-like domain-containing protein n=1 Tax=Levilactobacillus brevis TaxID=1580 RepID=UPI000427D33D|nr:PLP-dependent aminotransferase family protein [Levilactobacillus brevis]ATU70517.1 PLP-dependent aminotransferase family protein [Levilactobacillus brevis]KID43658.1 Transcriptional regulator, GntR family [Levilactobacillus brevis]MCU0200831.1 PLP-dependent aminotransferase family protein [Levilactobacillus brevis]ODP94013.1 aspartate aminotransferase [Levilactobacillus brevis]ORJ56255.1 aspartate aminotransferase [Levilactobacillus brevis]